jgi:Cof subfamily protein (haloacid dehalogenase superfamily)
MTRISYRGDEDMGRIRLIAVDMDGTFLRKDMSYDKERFKRLYMKMKEQGIRFVVASGNQYYQLKSFFEDYQDELTYVAENGALIVVDKEVVSSVKVPMETVMRVIDALRAYPEVKVGVCGLNSAYVLDNETWLYDYMSKYYQRLKKVERFDDVEDDVLKVALVTPVESTYRIRDELLAVLEGKLVPVIPMPDNIDLIAPGKNKGTAIALLQKRWGIDPSECLAFGDGGNDIEMMKQVGYSYAMKNASDELKAAAKYSASTNNEDGVLEIIEEYLQQEES